MRLLLTLILNDLRRRSSSPAGFLISMTIPLAIAGSMVLAFGGRGGGEAAAPKLELVVVDLDDSPLSGILAGAGQNGEASQYISTIRAQSPDEGLELMRAKGYHAMLVIPTGFMDAVLDGRSINLPLVKNPAKRIMPIVAQQGLEIVALYASVMVQMLPEGGAATVRRLVEGEGWDDAVGIAALVADTYSRTKRAGNLMFPPIIEVDRVKEQPSGGDEASGGFDFVSWMYPGIIVMGLLFVALNQMKDLLVEQEGGTLRRLLAGPVSVTLLLLSKVLSVGVSVAASLALFLLAGTLFFGVSWGPALPLAATSVALTLAATGFAALVYSLSRTQSQGDTFGSIAVILMSMLGGAFLPPQIMPAFLRGASKFTLNYWGNESFRVLTSGGSWPQLATHLPVLTAMALIAVGVGTFLLKQRHLRGAV